MINTPSSCLRLWFTLRTLHDMMILQLNVNVLRGVPTLQTSESKYPLQYHSTMLNISALGSFGLPDLFFFVN